MKFNKIIILFLIGIFVFNPLFAQKFTVKLSPVEKLDNKTYFNKHLYSNSSGHYILFNKREKGFEYFPVIKHFDNAFKLVYTKTFSVNKKRIQEIGVQYYKNKFAWMFYEKDKKAKTYNIYASSISMEGKSSKAKKIASIKIDKSDLLTSIRYIVSDDTTKTLIIVEFDKDIKYKNYKAYFCVLDNDLNKLWDKKFQLKVNQRKFDASSWGLNNEGSVYFIGKEYQNNRRREGKKDEKTKERVAAYTTSYYKFTDGSDKYTKISLDLKGSFIRDIAIRNDSDNNSIVVGLYSESTNGFIHVESTYSPILGTFYFKVNNEDNSIAFKNKNAFTNKQMNSFSRMYTTRDKKTKKLGINGTIKIKNLLVREDGNFNVVLEDNYISYTTKHKPIYNSNFIVFADFSNTGEQRVILHIPKKQYFEESPLFGSHSSLITEDNIYYLYNDKTYNYKNNIKKPYNLKALNNMYNSDAILAYFEDGKLIKKELFKSKELKNSLLAQSSIQISANKMIFFCVQGDLFTKSKFSMGTVSIN